MDKGVTWDKLVGGENIPEYVADLLEDEERETELSVEIDARELMELSQTDEVAQDYIERLADINGRGIASITNMYSPELITFSGSLATENIEFMENSFSNVEKYAINPIPEMKISELGNDFGLYGALALAQRGQ